MSALERSNMLSAIPCSATLCFRNGRQPLSPSSSIATSGTRQRSTSPDIKEMNSWKDSRFVRQKIERSPNFFSCLFAPHFPSVHLSLYFYFLKFDSLPISLYSMSRSSYNPVILSYRKLESHALR